MRLNCDLRWAEPSVASLGLSKLGYPFMRVGYEFFSGTASVWGRVGRARLRIRPDRSLQRLLRTVVFARILLRVCSHCLPAWLSQSPRDAFVCKTRKGRRRRRFGCETMEIKVTVAHSVDTQAEPTRASYKARGISPISTIYVTVSR